MVPLQSLGWDATLQRASMAMSKRVPRSTIDPQGNLPAGIRRTVGSARRVSQVSVESTSRVRRLKASHVF
jgi:hypothetical protein